MSQKQYLPTRMQVLAVAGEVSNVLASMRLNSRWSSRSKVIGQFSSQNYLENPLLKGFHELKNILIQSKDLSSMDTLVYLKPFLAVIRSEETSGPITGVALSSVNKFLKGFIYEHSINADKAIESIADSVTHCRFEATDPDSDEVVLMKILQVLLSCVKSPVGHLLPQDMIIEIVQTCYRMSTQLRLSELLRKTAEQTLTEIVYSVFSTNEPGAQSFSDTIWERIFQIICGMVTPTNVEERVEEDISILGLTLVNVVIDNSAQVVKKYPRMIQLIQEDLCKSLFKCFQSDSLQVLTRALTVFYNLFITNRELLKPHIELFFIMITKLMDNRSTTYEQLESALEFIVSFCKEPFFISELYVNYDCDYQCSNVLENLFKFLYKNSFPISGAIYMTHMLALESFLAIVQSIDSRNQIENKNENEIVEVRRNKQAKNLLMLAVEQFNKDPDEGISFLRKNQMISSDEKEAEDIAKFLRYTNGVSKSLIGEYIGKKKPLNTSVLDAYIATFPFKEHGNFILSIRNFLESFRIPGEAPIISRILEAFAKAYTGDIKEPFSNPDSVYVLTYSILMLNVDQHNPEVKTKMTEQEFIKNNRGINDNKDLPPEMLKEIYQTIKKNEIKIPEEHLMTDVGCVQRYLTNKSRVIGSYKFTNSALDQDIFSVISAPLLSSISVIFETADDDVVLSKTIDGFSTYARIASNYSMTESLDNLVVSLCKFSGLLSVSISSTAALSLFGRNKKAMLATRTAFLVAHNFGSYLRDGWKNITYCIITLQRLGTLPTLVDKLEPLDFGEDTPASTTPTQQSRASTLLGLLNTAAWFGAAEPSVDDLIERNPEAEQAAKDCINLCRVKDLISDIRSAHPDSIAIIIKTLILFSTKPQKPNAPYEEKTVSFCVDLMVGITAIAVDKAIAFWELLADHLIVLVNGNAPSGAVMDKSLMSLFVLSIKLLHYPETADKVLRSLTPLTRVEGTEGFSRRVILGFSKIVEAHPSLIMETSMGLETLKTFCEGATKFSSTEAIAFKVVNGLLNDAKFVSRSNILQLVEIISMFIKSTGATNIKSKGNDSLLPIQAMELLQRLFNYASDFVQQDSQDSIQSVWDTFWLPILQIFCKLCTENRSDVRNYAMTFLQKSLLSSQLSVLPGIGWYNCFLQVIFPLMRDLLKPLTPSSNNSSYNSRGMMTTSSDLVTATAASGSLEEIRLRASALLSKIFLQYLTKIIQLPNFSEFWLQILQFIEMYMKADESELLAEAVRESLKNILLVMSASGIFRPGVITSGQDIWSLSWSTIDSFCPSLKTEFDDVLNK